MISCVEQIEKHIKHPEKPIQGVKRLKIFCIYTHKGTATLSSGDPATCAQCCRISEQIHQIVRVYPIIKAPGEFLIYSPPGAPSSLRKELLNSNTQVRYNRRRQHRRTIIYPQ